MARLFCALFLLAVSALAANVKLYMKDGGYQLVREYTVSGDRVRFYSVERSAWEEIPLELVDLKRTETEVSQRKTKLAEEAKVLSEEDRVERQLQDEVMKIPQNPGVYTLEGDKAKLIKQAESVVRTSKGRSILKRHLTDPDDTREGNVSSCRGRIPSTSSPTRSRSSTFSFPPSSASGL